MATENLEYEMKECFKCKLHYPIDIIHSHKNSCSDMKKCKLCFCYYPEKEVNKHATKCRGIDDTVKYIAEHSSELYTLNKIRKLCDRYISILGPEFDVIGILKILNTKDFNIDALIKNRTVSKMECPICLIKVPLEDIFKLSCTDNHEVCYDCLLKHSKLKLNEKSPITCPNDNCKGIIHVNELKSFPFPQHFINKLVKKYDEQLFRTFVNNTKGVISCPNKSCKWVAMVDGLERLNVKCDLCETVFCTICRGKSHYRCECNEIPSLMQQWMIWCNTGRQARKNEKEKYNKYQIAKAANDNRNEELKRNFEQLKLDEEYKSKTCRHCPICNRIVEKLSGCDAMVCGQNYHGGDNQNGCGNRFNWTQARAYISQIENQPKLEELVLSAPKQAENVNHSPFKCDNCNQDIIGIRFECINCTSVNYCENCEEDLTLNHTNGHTFKLITKVHLIN